jgi:hypothetical protein
MDFAYTYVQLNNTLVSYQLLLLLFVRICLLTFHKSMLFSAPPDRPWGPPSLPYNGYRVFPGGKVRPGRAADHSPPSNAAIMEE